MTRSRPLILAGSALTLLCMATAAPAQHVGKSNGNASSATGVDAQGRLRPVTAAEARALAAGIARYVDQSSAGLTPVRHANGMVSIDLQDRFQSVALARVAADGSVDMRCVGTAAEARDYLRQKTKAPTRHAHDPKPSAAPAALEEK